jgi:hypothetical protein
MIGADNLTLEQTPTQDGLNFFPVHTYLLADAPRRHAAYELRRR